MKIKYIGDGAYQEFELTKVNALWQPGQTSDVYNPRLSLLLGSGRFVDVEIDNNEVQVFSKTNPLTGGVESFVVGTENILVPIPSGNYFFHGFAGLQVPEDSMFIDISGKNNHAVRGANLSIAQLWATPNYASVVDPAGGLTNSVLRIPALNFDYAGGEKVIIWWLGYGSPEGSNASFMGDSGSSAQPGIRVRANPAGKFDCSLFGAGAVSVFGATSAATLFDGSLHSMGVVIDGENRKYGYWVDQVFDSGMGSDYISYGATVPDTKTSNTFNIGTAWHATASSTEGLPIKTRALAILRLPPSSPCPSVAEMTTLFNQLRTNPSLRVLRGAV